MGREEREGTNKKTNMDFDIFVWGLFGVLRERKFTGQTGESKNHIKEIVEVEWRDPESF